MNSKAWYLSKTLWINLIAIVAMGLQTINATYIISPEIQAGILGIVNLILRAVTGSAVDWNAPASTAQPPEAGGPGTAGFIRVPLLLMLVTLCLAGLLAAGCATTAPAPSNPSTITAPGDTPPQLAGKSLLAVKSTIVAAATSVDALCTSGTMPADKCAQAKAAYELAQPAYDAAVDSYLLMSSGGGDPGDFGRALARVQGIAANLLTLSGGAK